MRLPQLNKNIVYPQFYVNYYVVASGDGCRFL